ncbi:glycosyl transferase family 1 [Weeksellaceae bacterium TAE3-ERU29]|nr:glycosyl transferase family 1 [Weeksellaceae bacterium TAE3-ERU29]
MKKVLLITYYWPPVGGAGVQRWLKMSKFIAEKCELTVFSPQNASYPIYDESLKNDISLKINHIQGKIWEPYALAKKINPKNNQYQKGQIEPKKNQSFLSKISLWIRANFFIPDARMFWISPSIKSIKNQLNLNEFDAIISTGPPHSCHLIALGLKESFPHLKWLADFRDPWTDIDYFPQLPLSSFALKKHLRLEKNVLKKADIVTTVSPSWAKDFEEKSGRNIEVVYNGFDDDDFKSITKNSGNKKLTITYVGSLNSDRNPSFFWQSLNEKCKNNQFKNIFEVKLIGNIAKEVKDEINDLEYLKSQVKFIPYMEHKMAIQELLNSSVLLLLINDTANQKGIIPGKFFEYLAAKRQILCIGKKDSDINKIINKTQSGKLIESNNTKEIEIYIDNLYKIFTKNNLDLPINEDSIEKYSRKKAAEKIIQLLNL